MSGHLEMPGAANYTSAPDIAAYDIVGDIDVRARIAPDDWTPTRCDVLSKWQSAGQRSYALGVTATGAITFFWSTDGTAQTTRTSDAVVSATDGDTVWVRATLDVDNGAAGHDVKFYTGGSAASPSWSQLGSTSTTAGTTSIFASTSNLLVGRLSTSFGDFIGGLYNAEVYSGIGGTVVLDADFTDLTAGEVTAKAFVEDSTNAATVTINGTGWTYVEDAAGSPSLMLMGVG